MTLTPPYHRTTLMCFSRLHNTRSTIVCHNVWDTRFISFRGPSSSPCCFHTSLRAWCTFVLFPSNTLRVCFTLSAREWVDVVAPLIFSLSIYPTAVSKTETRTVSRLFLFCVSEYPLIWDPPAMANDQVTGLGFQNIFFCTQFWLSWNVSSNRKKRWCTDLL